MISGMTKPSKVVGFLDAFGAAGWDPSLAFVMGGALAVTLPTFQGLGLVGRGNAELRRFSVRPVDTATVAAGILFGIGWGYGGLCPGPAATCAATGSVPALLWFAAMLGGRQGASLVA